MISDDEFFQISRKLESHHAIFYKLWEMGKPIFDENIKTAQVEFDRDGDLLAFVFSPAYWKRLSQYERMFIICHEALHVILNHGARIRDTISDDFVNMVLDIVVNEMLVSKFGFERSKLKDDKRLCWVDTVFENHVVSLESNPHPKGQSWIPKLYHKDKVPKGKATFPVPTDESFEYYYLLLKQHPDLKVIVVVLDNHEGLISGDVDEILENVDESLSNEEKDSIKDMVKNHYSENPETPAGKGSGFQWSFVDVGEVKKKRKWETVIKTWSRKYWRPDFKDIEQWARLNRRFSLLSRDLFLPSELEMEMEHEEKSKIDVWFFQDTSGSCIHLKNRFFRAAASLPPEKFNVRLFCFDTEIVETSMESKKVYGGGGTKFGIIEGWIQKLMNSEKKKYPEAVFVVTDGYSSNRVSPEFPKRWHFFLTGRYTRYIPEESNVYNLLDFE